MVYKWVGPGTPTDLVVSLGHDAQVAGQLTYLKAFLLGGGAKGVQPVQAGNTVVFTIPAADVVTVKPMKFVVKYRLAKDVPAGTFITFSVTGPGIYTDEVGIHATTKNMTKYW